MQVVGYESQPAVSGDESGAPGLYVATDGEVQFVDASAGTTLEFGLGARRCAGSIHEDGHVPCSSSDAPYCATHTNVWVCARCTGTCLKDEMDCHETHAMYLAAFTPDVFKVGVTRLWRLDTRLREQGADRAAHVRTFPDGRVAREVEAELAAADDLVDRVRVDQKLAGLGRSIDTDAWTSLLERFDPIDRFAFDYGFTLTDRPVKETMASGTVRGWKGRLLLLDRGGSTYAVDARDLVGYELVETAPDRRLQSSLGAFTE